MKPSLARGTAISQGGWGESKTLESVGNRQPGHLLSPLLCSVCLSVSFVFSAFWFLYVFVWLSLYLCVSVSSVSFCLSACLTVSLFFSFSHLFHTNFHSPSPPPPVHVLSSAGVHFTPSRESAGLTHTRSWT